jgi:hypothetical protein
MRRRSDRYLGIVLGLLLGIAVVAVFVFAFSGETVDAPSLDEGGGSTQQQERER